MTITRTGSERLDYCLSILPKPIQKGGNWLMASELAPQASKWRIVNWFNALIGKKTEPTWNWNRCKTAALRTATASIGLGATVYSAKYAYNNFGGTSKTLGEMRKPEDENSQTAEKTISRFLEKGRTYIEKASDQTISSEPYLALSNKPNDVSASTPYRGTKLKTGASTEENISRVLENLQNQRIVDQGNAFNITSPLNQGLSS